jgi:hypothetical protein
MCSPLEQEKQLVGHGTADCAKHILQWFVQAAAARGLYGYPRHTNAPYHTPSLPQVLLTPTAQAINAVVAPSTLVEFTLTGEQGLSVFTYPNAWAALLDRTKAVSAKWVHSQGFARPLGARAHAQVDQGWDCPASPSWLSLLKRAYVTGGPAHANDASLHKHRRTLTDARLRTHTGAHARAHTHTHTHTHTHFHTHAHTHTRLLPPLKLAGARTRPAT